MTGSTSFTLSKEKRPTVEVCLKDGRIITGPRNQMISEFLKVLPEFNEPPVVGAIINGELRELTYCIKADAVVQPITMTDDDGARIYRRSVTFLMEAAFEEIFPEAVLSVDHSVSFGGYFCQVMNHAPLSQEELDTLLKRMNELVDRDLPFQRKEVPLEEAIAYFKKRGYDEKVRLLKFREKQTLVLYTLETHRDYHHGYMVPSTSYLQFFDLQAVGDGFVLRFPRRNSPKSLQPMPDYPKLLTAFRQYGNWLQRLGIESVGYLDEAIEEKRISDTILVSEALHTQHISSIADQIIEHRDKVRVVLIAGPSSSGKTTFSRRLAVQLLAQGLSPFAMEMDNYFVDRKKTPRDANGQYDYESLEALDRDQLSEHLSRLIAGDEVRLAHYDFKTGKSGPGDLIKLEKGQLIILEGIHGLNPDLIPGFPVDQTFRIYASCLTQLNLDRHNRISTTDTRLLRRIVRDARERGYTAQQTINRWESVRRGEKEHIFPYQENADVFFNSALVYELAVLKPLVEPLLRQTIYGTPEYIEAKRLLAFLTWFLPLDSKLVPDNSILREFTGGSIIKDFRLWRFNGKSDENVNRLMS
ncbi:MAG: nucleoside kinase [Anaerolineaceae bacterium]|nr:nucleoside kinase [Anaerolineaceae bacterium]